MVNSVIWQAQQEPKQNKNQKHQGNQQKQANTHNLQPTKQNPKERASFCCTLLACHLGRGRSPSVSEVGEKTDLPTFHNNAKQNTQIKQQCKQTTKDTN